MLIENPLFLPALDREFIWNQTVDAIDDYFRIEREERVRLIGGVLTEGRIDTFPTIGSTMFEPWRVDSTPGYEKLHATLQSIRRRATVRVIPTDGGYLLDVVVHKELEDLDKPEHATAGGATLRHDGTLVRQQAAPGRYSVTLGWIPIGRDVSLEQRILADISARLDVHPAPAAHAALPHVEEIQPPFGEPGGPELGPAMPQERLPPVPEVLPPPSSEGSRRAALRRGQPVAGEAHAKLGEAGLHAIAATFHSGFLSRSERRRWALSLSRSERRQSAGDPPAAPAATG